MRINRRFTWSIAPVLALAVMFSFSLGVAAQGRGHHAGQGPSAGDPSIIFTFDGKPVGKPISGPSQANNFEVFWKVGHCVKALQLPPVAVEWTYHGLLIAGDPPLSPCRANDVKIVWRPIKTAAGLDNAVVAAFWTYHLKDIKKIRLPNGGLVNSFGGQPQTAPYADDACFELSYIKTGIAKAIWTLNEKPLGKPIPVPYVPGTKRHANDVCWYGYGSPG